MANTIKTGDKVVAINWHGEAMHPGVGVVRNVYTSELTGEERADVFWFSNGTFGGWPVSRIAPLSRFAKAVR